MCNYTEKGMEDYMATSLLLSHLYRHTIPVAESVMLSATLMS